MTKLRILTVTDLHQSLDLYIQLASAVKTHRPDVICFVGDFLDAYFPTRRGCLTAAETAARIADLSGEIIFVRGNHEDTTNWPDFGDMWSSIGRPLITLHGESFQIGGVAFIGWDCTMGDEFSFRGNRPELPHPPDHWLLPVLQETNDAKVCIWLSHEPPFGVGFGGVGVMEGRDDLTQAIQTYQPHLVISGHNHHPKQWFVQLGRTYSIDLGQETYPPGTLRFGIIELDFAAVGHFYGGTFTSHPDGQVLILPASRNTDVSNGA